MMISIPVVAAIPRLVMSITSPVNPEVDTETTFIVGGECQAGNCGTNTVNLQYNTFVGGGCSASTNFGATSCGINFIGVSGDSQTSGDCTGFTENSDNTFQITCSNAQTFTVDFKAIGCDVGDYEIQTESSGTVTNACDIVDVIAPIIPLPPLEHLIMRSNSRLTIREEGVLIIR